MENFSIPENPFELNQKTNIFLVALRLYSLIIEQVFPGQFYFPLHIVEQPEQATLSDIRMISFQLWVLQPIACLL